MVKHFNVFIGGQSDGEFENTKVLSVKLNTQEICSKGGHPSRFGRFWKFGGTKPSSEPPR